MSAAVNLGNRVLFDDRRHAGRALAAAVPSGLPGPVAVYGLARGGVPVAAEVARALGAPLDVLVVRKIGHPREPELALGAVVPRGLPVLVEPWARDPPPTFALRDRIERADAEGRAMDSRLHARTPAMSPRGTTCLLVDDGLATGATMVAACRWARAGGAGRVLAAVPVAARESLRILRTEADGVVCPYPLDDFWAVGVWYRDFGQVSEDEVRRLLDAGRPAPDASRPPGRGVRVPSDGAVVEGDLVVPTGAEGLVVFAHGSGSSRHSPRNRRVAAALAEAGLGTLLIDLLTPEEEAVDRVTAEHRFDIGLLARRLVDAVDWAARIEPALPVGLFGASTGAAAALVAAALRPERVRAVVSRGGRPDLAGDRLADVDAPTLLIVGSLDAPVIPLNRLALAALGPPSELRLVPGATHLFEEPGALEAVAGMASGWFLAHLPERR